MTPFRAAGLLVSAVTLCGVMLGCQSPDGDGHHHSHPEVSVPDGHEQVTRLHAEGVQIYNWTGTNWVLRGPEATLFKDAKTVAGKHYKQADGPVWENSDGSKVVGKVITNAPAYASNAIPHLLLKAVSTAGHGVFTQVSYIQRVDTVGGKTPAAPGNTAGQEAREKYAAEYIFYRKAK